MLVSYCSSNRLEFFPLHHSFVSNIKYEGCSINKLENGVILLIFDVWKIRNIRFVGNLILTTRREFHCGDVTVTSSTSNKCNGIAAESIPWGTVNGDLLFSVDTRTQRKCHCLRHIQYNIVTTSLLRDQQRVFIVRCLLVVKKPLLVTDEKRRRPGRAAVPATAATSAAAVHFSYRLTTDKWLSEIGWYIGK